MAKDRSKLLIINDKDSLKDIMDQLSLEIYVADQYFKIYQELKKNKSKFTKEFENFDAFWSFIYKALPELAIVCLMRFYDTYESYEEDKKVISLISFLKSIKDNNVVSKLIGSERVNQIKAELIDNIDFCKKKTKSNELQKLRKIRNKIFAHKSLNINIDKITCVEISNLLEKSKDIINYYCRLFFNAEPLFEVIRHVQFSDFECILNMMKEQLELRRKRYNN